MGTLNVAYGAQITAAATRYGLDPRLLAAVAAQETGGPGANSGANIVGDGGHGRGLFQIDDRWHSFASTPAAMDPQANADYAAGMISNLLQQNGGNVKAALSAYNAGSPTATGTTTTWGDGQTLGYADSVLRHYSRLAGTAAPAIATAGTSMTSATLAGATASGTSTLDQTSADNALNQIEQAQLQSMYQNSMSQSTTDLTSTNTVAAVDPDSKAKDTSSTQLLDTGAADDGSS